MGDLEKRPPDSTVTNVIELALLCLISGTSDFVKLKLRCLNPNSDYMTTVSCLTQASIEPKVQVDFLKTYPTGCKAVKCFPFICTSGSSR